MIPTRLCPRKKQVDIINQRAMNKLASPSFFFEAQRSLIPSDELDLNQQRRMEECSPEARDYEYTYLFNNVNCSHQLELKEGAQVESNK